MLSAFLAFFFPNIFLLHFLSLFSFCDSSYTYTVYYPTGHCGSVHFVPVLFCRAMFKFTYPFFCHLPLAVQSPSRDAFISCIVLFSSRIWFVSAFSVPLLAFPICALLMAIFSFKSLDTFLMAILKLLSAKSSIWVISELVCLENVFPRLRVSFSYFFLHLDFFIIIILYWSL